MDHNIALGQHKAIILAALDHAISESKTNVLKVVYANTRQALDEGYIGLERTDRLKAPKL